VYFDQSSHLEEIRIELQKFLKLSKKMAESDTTCSTTELAYVAGCVESLDIQADCCTTCSTTELAYVAGCVESSDIQAESYTTRDTTDPAYVVFTGNG